MAHRDTETADPGPQEVLHLAAGIPTNVAFPPSTSSLAQGKFVREEDWVRALDSRASYRAAGKWFQTRQTSQDIVPDNA